MRRHAGALLESVSPRAPGALRLALQIYRSALAQRPEHPSNHRRLGYALLRAGDPEQAVEVFRAALGLVPCWRYHPIRMTLEEDLGLAAAARAKGADRPSMRVALSWDTSDSDLDLHVLDRWGREVWHSASLGPSGRIRDDVTDGYGPEVFLVDGEAHGFPYRVEVRSYRQGPTGHALGSVDIVRHDGRGGLTFDTRPFVIMTEGASVDLGTIEDR
jgi:hypothetical protein